MSQIGDGQRTTATVYRINPSNGGLDVSAVDGIRNAFIGYLEDSTCYKFANMMYESIGDKMLVKMLDVMRAFTVIVVKRQDKQ